LVRECGGEPVASSPVGEPGPAHVTVVPAGGDQLGHGELVERARPVGQPPLGERFGDQIGREDEPAEA
jgi:hypothetical protein